MEKLAVVFDFDDTLAPDSTHGFLEFMGVDTKKFWKETVDPMIKDGWDPHTAYLYGLIEYSQTLATQSTQPSSKKFTKEKFEEWGRQLTYLPGVEEVFKNLREEVKELSGTFDKEFEIEFYVISSGIKEILDEVSIRNEFKMLWASRFHYDENGGIKFPKNLVSFTDKTRYLFHISKGLTDEKYLTMPFKVNERIPLQIPLDRMIFVGDGYTDIACFALLRKFGGKAIMVFDKNRREKWQTAWNFSNENRVTGIASADYTKSSDLYMKLTMAISDICKAIADGK